MQAIETTGVIDFENNLKINTKIGSKYINKSVKVIILLNENKPKPDELDEHLWKKAVSSNPVFDFLADHNEDIYSLTDGKAFQDEV